MAKPRNKLCHRCGDTKPRAAFHKSRGTGDGLQSWCKECMLAVNSTNRQTDEARAADAKRKRIARTDPAYRARVNRQRRRGREAAKEG